MDDVRESILNLSYCERGEIWSLRNPSVKDLTIYIKIGYNCEERNYVYKRFLLIK